MDIVTPMTSDSWKASVPTATVATWPVITTSGVESYCAVAMPVTQLRAPGPLVANTTPAVPRFARA